MLWLMLALAGLLLAIHMARPHFRPGRISSAAFFRNLPPPRLAGGKLRWGRPEFSRAFLLQALVLLLLLAALLAHHLRWRVPHAGATGLWVLVDTSAGMGAADSQSLRRVAPELESMLKQIEDRFQGVGIHYKLSAFDLELRDILEGDNSASLLAQVRQLSARPLGTDMGLIRNLLKRGEFPEKITHLLVFSDMPAPDFANEAPLIWTCVGQKVANVGLGGIGLVPDVFSGGTAYVNLGLHAFGPAPEQARFSLIGPNQEHLINLEPIPWQGDITGAGSSWNLRFPVTQAGSYRLELVAEDVFPLDNLAVLDLSPGGTFQVDWQARPHPLAQQLGWQQSGLDPSLTVRNQWDPGDEGPTIVLVPMLQAKNAAPIQLFSEGHPVLADLNLDALEQLGFVGFPLQDGFNAVLANQQGLALVAESGERRTLMIPAFPEPFDQRAEPVVATLFFNASRYLLGRDQGQTLVDLTSPLQPEPGPNHLALHPEEGNLWRTPVSQGSLEVLQQRNRSSEVFPFWAMFLALAVMVLVLERILNLVGGARTG